MFKPPKLFSSKPNTTAPADATPPPPPAAAFTPTPAQEPVEPAERVWSPTGEPPAEASVPEAAAEPVEEVVAEPAATESGAEAVEEPESIEITEEVVAEPAAEPQETIPSSEPTAVPAPAADDESRYARPRAADSRPSAEQAVFVDDDTPDVMAEPADASFIPEPLEPTPEAESPDDTIKRILGNDQKIIKAPSVSSIPFSDIWYTAEKIAYIRDKNTRFALIPFEADDLEDFYKTLEQGYTGQSSYAIRFAGEQYRVERIITMTGPQYNCRKMPTTVPDIYTLGLPKHVVDYLLTLAHESGLLLFGGPTGMGKTTSASALMKKFLEMEGGFMYTIEDPPEMPLDGLYHAQNGGLGLCKQCPVDNERWGDGIKSALRSRPRYILVGEIRTPETASQVLRAATSGHLVLSTIHASTVEDSLESLIKYASGAGLTESLAADLLARGILGVIHQKLEGSEVLRPVITSAFANPHLTGGDQMRSLIRNNTINLQTLVEAQSSRLFQGRPLFGGEAID